VFQRILRLLPALSLERKCLLFFGMALTLLMCATFWFFQFIAQGQAMQVPRQTAKDFANMLVSRLHHDAMLADAMTDPVRLADARKTLRLLDKYFLNALPRGSGVESGAERGPAGLIEGGGERDFNARFVTLGNEPDFEGLRKARELQPANPAEQQILDRLEKEYRSRLTELFREQAAKGAQPDPNQVLGADNAFGQITPLAAPLFAEAGPSRGRYLYYAPVIMQSSCMSCHAPVNGWPNGQAPTDPAQLAASMPFRVVRVSLPYGPTEDTLTWIRAVIVALAMLIVAVTLVVLHTIVRYLVLKPMYHLRDVSDQISRGSSQLRAELDTDDEFEELGDAFNRMLQHLMETQTRQRDLNQALDQKVDQLAQLNLQLYEANRLKSDFLTNMSHELRTPLNSIIGFSDVLADIDALNDKQRRYARNIQQSGRVLLEMINDILDLAKVEAGKMEVRPGRFDLRLLVQAQCDMVRSLSEEKNIDLNMEMPEELPSVWQDANKIGQILTNLLSNAIKFTPEGGVVTVRVADQDDGQFSISVEDSGVGIPEEDHAVIFEKFRQSRVVSGDDGLKREFSGTGLGLSIVKELCKLLGGEIRFTSELGKGSNFIVTLPWRFKPPGSMSAGEHGLGEDGRASVGETDAGRDKKELQAPRALESGWLAQSPAVAPPGKSM